MEIFEQKINIYGVEIFFYHIKNDPTITGTVHGLQINNWKYDNIQFQDGDNFVDLGCNVGLVSMIFAKLFPQITVHAVDANPTAYKLLQMGISKNNLNNIKIYNLAIGDENKGCFFGVNTNDTCSIVEDYAGVRDNTFKVEMVQFDKIFSIFNIDKIKYIKIDIECGEFQLFEYIQNKCPEVLDKIEYMHLEIHPIPDLEKRINLKNYLTNKFKEKGFIE